MHKTTKLNICDINPHLLCVLCGGYFVDATAIIECLHSFCRSCITKYLDGSKCCPICDVQVHKTRPLVNLRPDKTLQSLVYKLVPGLYKREMARRREFYKEHPDHAPSLSAPNACEEAGDVNDDRYTVREEPESISLVLQHCDRLPLPSNDIHMIQGKSDKELKTGCDKRYLLCPSGVCISHMKRFIRSKFDIQDDFQIEVFFHGDETIPEDYTLADVAYVYGWTRVHPLKLYYMVLDTKEVCIELPTPATYNPIVLDEKPVEMPVEMSSQIYEDEEDDILPKPETEAASVCSLENEDTAPNTNAESMESVVGTSRKHSHKKKKKKKKRKKAKESRELQQEKLSVIKVRIPRDKIIINDDDSFSLDIVDTHDSDTSVMHDDNDTGEYSVSKEQQSDAALCDPARSPVGTEDSSVFGDSLSVDEDSKDESEDSKDESLVSKDTGYQADENLEDTNDSSFLQSSPDTQNDKSCSLSPDSAYPLMKFKISHNPTSHSNKKYCRDSLETETDPSQTNKCSSPISDHKDVDVGISDSFSDSCISDVIECETIKKVSSGDQAPTRNGEYTFEILNTEESVVLDTSADLAQRCTASDISKDVVVEEIPPLVIVVDKDTGDSSSPVEVAFGETIRLQKSRNISTKRDIVTKDQCNDMEDVVDVNTSTRDHSIHDTQLTDSKHVSIPTFSNGIHGVNSNEVDTCEDVITDMPKGHLFGESSTTSNCGNLSNSPKIRHIECIVDSKISETPSSPYTTQISSTHELTQKNANAGSSSCGTLSSIEFHNSKPSLKRTKTTESTTSHKQAKLSDARDESTHAKLRNTWNEKQQDLSVQSAPPTLMVTQTEDVSSPQLTIKSKVGVHSSLSPPNGEVTTRLDKRSPGKADAHGILNGVRQASTRVTPSTTSLASTSFERLNTSPYSPRMGDRSQIELITKKSRRGPLKERPVTLPMSRTVPSKPCGSTPKPRGQFNYHLFQPHIHPSVSAISGLAAHVQARDTGPMKQLHLMCGGGDMGFSLSQPAAHPLALPYPIHGPPFLPSSRHFLSPIFSPPLPPRSITSSLSPSRASPLSPVHFTSLSPPHYSRMSSPRAPHLSPPIVPAVQFASHVPRYAPMGYDAPLELTTRKTQDRHRELQMDGDRGSAIPRSTGLSHSH